MGNSQDHLDTVETRIWQKALIDASLDAVIIIDEDGYIQDFNPAAETTFGYQRAAVLGKPMAQLLVPSNLRDAHDTGLARIKKTGVGKILGQRMELPAVKSDGTEFPVELIVVQVPISPRPLYVGYVRDISDRKRAEETLRASEQRFRALANTAPVMIWLTAGSTKRTWFNRSWLDFVGAELEPQVRGEWLSAIHPDDLENYLEKYESALTRKESYTTEFRLRHHDGQYRWILDHAAPVPGLGDNDVQYAGFCIDITQRREAEDKLRLTQFSVDHAADAVYWAGPDGRFVYVNDQACRSLGYSSDELLQRSALDIAPSLQNDEWAAGRSQLKSAGNVSLETHFRRKDGTVFPVEILASYMDFKGQQINCACVRDITERRESQAALIESEQKLSAIMGAAIDAVILSDPEGRIALCNPAAESIFGLTRGNLLGRSINQLLVSSSDNHREQSLQEAKHNSRLLVLDGDEVIHEMRAVRANGFEVAVDVSIASVGLESKTWCVAVIRDATERKSFEKRLTTALHDAQAANRAKSDFLAVVSHEMRTPLNAILGTLELVLDAPVDEEQREMLDSCQRSGTHLKELIDDILDYSQIQSGRIKLQQRIVALDSLLARIRDTFSQKTQSKGLEFRWEIEQSLPHFVSADGRRIYQVIENLLNNAVKFTDQGFVSLRASLTSANELTVVVEDSGIGVAPEHRDRIFRRFEQVDSGTTREFGGVGLGLAICAELVDLMRGELAYDELDDGGSRFRFTVPVQLPTQKEITTSETRSTRSVKGDSLAGTRILLAEDDPPSRKVATRILESAGIVVHQAVDGRQAVDIFRQDPDRFDAIFMDMMMPHLDGLQATSEIRALQRRSIPIVAMTAQAMSGDRERILEAGLDAYISKPIDRNRVLSTLSDLLSDSRYAHTEARARTSPNSSDFDGESLLERCQGDKDFVAELVELFQQTLDETLAAIEAGLANSDRQTIRKAAHRLKGAAGNMCASSVFEAAKRLEGAAVDRSWEACVEGCQRLRRAADIALVAIQNYLSESPG